MAEDAKPGVMSALQRSRTTNTKPPPRAEYPRVSAIPRTSESVLEENSAEAGTEPKTVLYLAYGSNLCAETFLGVRGIRPLSQINVSAPSLRLTFDLAGLPYKEPCFANTAPRKIPKPPPPPDLPDPRDPKLPVPAPPKVPEPGPVPIPGKKPTWDKGLVGVVYEVTKEDYAKIVATEGGGASYKEILVPCLAIPPRMNIPEKPPGKDFPRPFLARTLCAPSIPDAPDDKDKEEDKEDGKEDPEDPRKKWWWKLVKRPQREEDYAEPSARYLKLITDGAREHDLPDEYQRYLNALQPYTVTSRRQKMGQVLMLMLCAPLFLIIRFLAPALADGNGRMPTWMSVLMGAWFNLVWMVYDVLFKPIFGDGERTEEQDDDDDDGNGDEDQGRETVRKPGWRMEWCRDTEKRCLLGGVDGDDSD